MRLFVGDSAADPHNLWLSSRVEDSLLGLQEITTKGSFTPGKGNKRGQSEMSARVDVPAAHNSASSEVKSERADLLTRKEVPTMQECLALVQEHLALVFLFSLPTGKSDAADGDWEGHSPQTETSFPFPHASRHPVKRAPLGSADINSRPERLPTPPFLVRL